MGQHQICAFGKYENGLPLLCRDDAACKDWQEVSAKSAQTDDNCQRAAEKTRLSLRTYKSTSIRDILPYL